MSRPYAYVTQGGRVVGSDVLEDFAVKQGSQQPPDQKAFAGVRGLAAPRHDPKALAQLLDVNTAHAAAVRQKAVDVAGGGWRFDPRSPDADVAQRDMAEAFFDDAQPARTALDHPHFGAALHAAQLDYEALGRGALELIRDHHGGGQLVGIAHVPAHTIRVGRKGDRFLQQRGGVFRWFRAAAATDIDVDYESGQVYRVGTLRPERRAHDVVWWRNYHPLDPTYGVPDVVPALGAVKGDTARRDYNIDFFQNYGVPAYAVFVTGDFDAGPLVDPDTGEEVEEGDSGVPELDYHIGQMFKEVRQNPHASMVFTLPTRPGAEDGKVEVTFQPLATDVKEASFRLYRKDNREEVLSSHRMSSALAGVFDAGAANREALHLYRRSVVLPRQQMVERVLNAHVLRDGLGITGWRLRLNAFETRDLQRELDIWETLLENGAVTLRQLIGHFAEPLGLPHPPDTEDPVLDGRRQPDSGQDDAAGVGATLAQLRDSMAALAARATPPPAASNGAQAAPDADTARAYALLAAMDRQA